VLLSESSVIHKTGQEIHLGSKNIPCDGLIFFCPRKNWNRYLKVIRAWEIPTVLVRRTTPVKGITSITNDDFEGAQVVLEHLYSMGHRRIGLYSQEIWQGPAPERVNGYVSFMKDKGLYRGELIYDTTDPKALPFDKWFPKARAMKPTAFFCGSDWLATEFVKQAARYNLHVPQDLAVTGYNNNYIAELFNPTLTSINIPVEQMLETACTFLYQKIEGSGAEVKEVKFDNELIVRESSGKTIAV
jgi:DNA-binding LacI/PurR family transcriptional regulator